MNGKNTVVILIVVLIIMAVAFYSLNERMKGIERGLAYGGTNNYFLSNNATNNVSIEKIEAQQAVIGDNTTTTVNNIVDDKEKTT